MVDLSARHHNKLVSSQCPLLKGSCCLFGCQSDFNETCRLTDSQQFSHFSQHSEPVVSEVLAINVRCFNTDTALAVHGCSLLTSTDQSCTLRDSSRNDRRLTPHRWLHSETRITVLA